MASGARTAATITVWFRTAPNVGVSVVAVSSVRPVLPYLLDFVARTDFPAELVTTLTADWDDAPTVYGARTTKLVLRRAPLSNAADSVG
jgi:hypothetical protein